MKERFVISLEITRGLRNYNPARLRERPVRTSLVRTKGCELMCGGRDFCNGSCGDDHGDTY
jgi:hypothetical protein